MSAKQALLHARKHPGSRLERDTLEQQYRRFLETAKKIEASDDPSDFGRAFGRAIRKPAPKKPRYLRLGVSVSVRLQ